ncbi:uncharacterized protein LOC130666517 [Microplitis mediator]|uniref:uncharacterized protein LOC130666517 n=1 Tax=Microplitis mediator TaxID=375433 RepID=UPI0025535548|nr:uncharacterized protein LOC130666517 [Microplitis mediator]XP_057323574.1 uncharacterized protein LOC130666517 [Microplitis mediator]XP_057323575.1 uncharacterized protein LOC130666517 [Microplitis mediator]XP_057323576.1 uncharacterized protein LOC130666517 [Microplitis mediator]XP_057323578.1 uncharacterized protein LOC130666517 [Microplitis mediator]
MDALILTVRSFTENLIKRDCFCDSNFFRYEEGAKLCLCENEYRKLKNYVGHFKYLECWEIVDNDIHDFSPSSKENKIIPKSKTKDTERVIAMLMILEIEDKLKYLNSKKIITNPLYTEIHDKVKLLKSEYPSVLAFSKQLRQVKDERIYSDLKRFHLHRNLLDHPMDSQWNEIYKEVENLKREMS